MKSYFFSTGYGKHRIEAGSLHTALHKLAERLEHKNLSWRVNGKYNFHIVLDFVANKEYKQIGYL